MARRAPALAIRAAGLAAALAACAPGQDPASPETMATVAGLPFRFEQVLAPGSTPAAARRRSRPESPLRDSGPRSPVSPGQSMGA